MSNPNRHNSIKDWWRRADRPVSLKEYAHEMRSTGGEIGSAARIWLRNKERAGDKPRSWGHE